VNDRRYTCLMVKQHKAKSIVFAIVELTIIVLVFDEKMAVRCMSLSRFTELHNLCALLSCVKVDAISIHVTVF
jgi:hypothetical protein